MIEYFKIPEVCPVCGSPTKIECKVASEVLVCTNPECEGSLLNRIEHYGCKKGLDIKGLSKATIEKLIDWGWVNKIADLYELYQKKQEWIAQPGFGVKSVGNILAAIEDSKTPKLSSFICALGIPNVGKTLSAELVKYFDTYEEFRDAAKAKWDFTQIDGVAYEKASAIWNFDFTEADVIASYMCGYENDKLTTSNNLEGESICITGRLQLFSNRDELVQAIQAHGGKVVSGVSKKTTWLINNDINSNSAKNTSAQRFGIPIITEAEFANLYLS